jgi:hypothetical protein
MDQPIKSVKELPGLFVQACRAASGYFKSIEVWLMFAMAGLTVAGLFLAVMGEASSIAAFVTVIAYFTARPILHVKGILKWPFL